MDNLLIDIHFPGREPVVSNRGRCRVSSAQYLLSPSSFLAEKLHQLC